MPAHDLVVCPSCDSVFRRVAAPARGVASCARCATPLYRGRSASLDYLAALAVTGLIVFLIANCYPIVQLDVRAERSATTLWGAVVATYQSGYMPLAALALICALLFPLLQILVSLYVVLPLRMGIRPPAMHALRYMWPWSAVEVFMLGALVAVVKLGNVAIVVTGPGLYGFGVLTVLLTLVGSFDVDELWLAGEKARAL
jgi:paraquat-inducible protein A